MGSSQGLAVKRSRPLPKAPKWVDKAWKNCVRRAALEIDQETGEINMMAVARTLVSLAKQGDVASIKEFGDRIDGRVEAPLDPSLGQTFNFVVALPAVAQPDQWGKQIEAQAVTLGPSRQPAQPIARASGRQNERGNGSADRAHEQIGNAVTQARWSGNEHGSSLLGDAKEQPEHGNQVEVLPSPRQEHGKPAQGNQWVTVDPCMPSPSTSTPEGKGGEQVGSDVEGQGKHEASLSGHDVSGQAQGNDQQHGTDHDGHGPAGTLSEANHKPHEGAGREGENGQGHGGHELGGENVAKPQAGRPANQQQGEEKAGQQGGSKGTTGQQDGSKVTLGDSHIVRPASASNVVRLSEHQS